MAKITSNKIDVIYTWVDSNDPLWQKEFTQFKHFSSTIYAAHPCRFRDNGELYYSLLSLERFAPWINQIFIIKKSYQFPSISHLSMETQHKIIWVDEDSLKPPSLSYELFYPTFNSLAIEANLHRIPNLGEHFIYFNNDMFLGKEVEPCFFFPEGKIRLSIKQNYFFNNRLVLQTLRYFSKKHPSHIMNAYDIFNAEIGNLKALGLPFYRLPIHQCAPLLKSSYEWLWQHDEIAKQLMLTSSSKFRSPKNIHTVHLSSLISLWLKKAILFKEEDIKIYLYQSSLNKKLLKLQKIRPERFCINDSLINYGGKRVLMHLNEFMDNYFYKKY